MPPGQGTSPSWWPSTYDSLAGLNYFESSEEYGYDCFSMLLHMYNHSEKITLPSYNRIGIKYIIIY